MVTIRKGEAWGSAVPVPTGVPLFDTDAAASSFLAERLAAPASDGSGALPVELGLHSGDLARTMGGGTPDRFSGDVVRAPVDLLRLTADGNTWFALAHVVLRCSRRWGWWRGRLVFAMNAQYLGRYDVAPRSHPNDGRVDVVDVSARMSLRDRLHARRRAPSGTHLPHPHISTTSGARWEATFERPMRCWVDGRMVGTARSIEVEVVPDALLVYA